MDEVNLCYKALRAYLCIATQIPAQVNPVTPAYGLRLMHNSGRFAFIIGLCYFCKHQTYNV